MMQILKFGECLRINYPFFWRTRVYFYLPIFIGMFLYNFFIFYYKDYDINILYYFLIPWTGCQLLLAVWLFQLVQFLIPPVEKKYLLKTLTIYFAVTFSVILYLKSLLDHHIGPSVIEGLLNDIGNKNIYIISLLLSCLLVVITSRQGIDYIAHLLDCLNKIKESYNSKIFNFLSHYFSTFFPIVWAFGIHLNFVFSLSFFLVIYIVYFSCKLLRYDFAELIGWTSYFIWIIHLSIHSARLISLRSQTFFPRVSAHCNILIILLNTLIFLLPVSIILIFLEKYTILMAINCALLYTASLFSLTYNKYQRINEFSNGKLRQFIALISLIICFTVVWLMLDPGYKHVGFFIFMILGGLLLMPVRGPSKFIINSKYSLLCCLSTSGFVYNSLILYDNVEYPNSGLTIILGVSETSEAILFVLLCAVMLLVGTHNLNKYAIYPN